MEKRPISFITHDVYHVFFLYTLRLVGLIATEPNQPYSCLFHTVNYMARHVSLAVLY